MLKELRLYLSNNIKIVLTYGHTVGHSSLEFKQGERRILVAGDAIKSSPDDNDSISEGKIVINDGTFDIESFSDAFQAKKIIYINKFLKIIKCNF